MGLRPEDIYDSEYVALNTRPGTITAKLEVTELMGNEVFLYLVTGATSHIARVDPRTKAKVGNTIRLVVNLNNVHFFEKGTSDNRALR